MKPANSIAQFFTLGYTHAPLIISLRFDSLLVYGCIWIMRITFLIQATYAREHHCKNMNTRRDGPQHQESQESYALAFQQNGRPTSALSAYTLTHAPGMSSHYLVGHKTLLKMVKSNLDSDWTLQSSSSPTLEHIYLPPCACLAHTHLPKYDLSPVENSVYHSLTGHFWGSWTVLSDHQSCENERQTVNFSVGFCCSW